MFSLSVAKRERGPVSSEEFSVKSILTHSIPSAYTMGSILTFASHLQHTAFRD